MSSTEELKNKALQLIEKLSETNHELYDKHFLRTWDHTDETIKALVYCIQAFECMIKCNISCKLFTSGLAVSNFRDKSTRTRFSFHAATNLLGLSVHEIDETKSQVAHGETVRETANMTSFYTEAIGIRDDIFLGQGYKYQKEVADSIDEGYEKGVLNTRPVVVDLQNDEDHSSQAMCDLVHLIDQFGSLEALKGKKIAMTWAYSPSYGKPLSVPQGIIGLMSRFGMDVHLAYPEGYDLIPEVVEIAKENSKKSGGSFTVSNSMEEAFQDADIVYPKSWAPFSIMQERTELLLQGSAGKEGLEKLEKKCLLNNTKYKDWECTEEKMKLTKKGEALYMHCLPADITGVSCKEGEVSKEVFEKYRIKTYKEASHKMYHIASVIALSKFKNLPEILKKKVLEAPKKKLN